MTVGELEVINNSSDSLLKKMAIQIKAQNINVKRLEDALLVEIEARGEGEIVKVDTIYIIEGDTIFGKYIEINDGYLTLDLYDFGQDTVDYEYVYTEEIFIATYLDYGLNKKGKERFFLWRWLKPNWQSETSVKSLNKNSEIVAATELEVLNRRSRKRK